MLPFSIKIKSTSQDNSFPSPSSSGIWQWHEQDVCHNPRLNLFVNEVVCPQASPVVTKKPDPLPILITNFLQNLGKTENMKFLMRKHSAIKAVRAYCSPSIQWLLTYSTGQS